jgi:hypothetical protein
MTEGKSMSKRLRQFLRECRADGRWPNDKQAYELGLATLEAALTNNRTINRLRKELIAMSTTDRAALDAAFANLQQAEASRDAVIEQALADLKAKVASGAIATPEDFTAELDILHGLTAGAAAITAEATAADPGPALPSPAPTPTPTPVPDVPASDAPTPDVSAPDVSAPDGGTTGSGAVDPTSDSSGS